MKRRALLTNGPAAILLALLPAGLAQRVRAQDVPSRAPSTLTLYSAAGPEIITMPPDAPIFRDLEEMWAENMRKADEVNRLLTTGYYDHFGWWPGSPDDEADYD